MKIQPLALLLTALMATGPLPSSQRSMSHPAAPPLSDDDVSTVITGEFSGNTHVDAVVLANGHPVLRESIETYETYLRADLVASDIARLRGTGASGRDQVVAVGPDGLTLLELLDPPSASPWRSTSLRGGGTLWARAIGVRIGQVDGLDGDDIVAVTPDHVLVARSDGSGGWKNDVVFVGGPDVTGVELFDWDGESGGALELAVLAGSNATGAATARLFRPDGTLLQTLLAGGDGMIAAPLATDMHGPRWLAAVSTRALTGEQDLVLLSSAGVAGPWSLGIAGVQDCVAVDWDGDGIEDLVLGTSTSRNAWLYRITSAGPMNLTLHDGEVPPNLPIQMPVGHPRRDVAAQDGHMAVADVDYDGDLDLVTAVQGRYQGAMESYVDSRFSTVSVTRNDAADHHDWLSWHTPGTAWPTGLPYPALDTDSGNLSVFLLTPDRLLSRAQFEYGVWRAPGARALALPTPILGPGALPIGLEGADGLTWSTLTIPLGQHGAQFPDRYTLIIRQVERDASGGIKAESPALRITFFSDAHSLDSIAWNIEISEEPSGPDKPDEPGGATTGPGLPPTGPNQRP